MVRCNSYRMSHCGIGGISHCGLSFASSNSRKAMPKESNDNKPIMENLTSEKYHELQNENILLKLQNEIILKELLEERKKH